jgi:O-antigen/teichoic acid export membrane protein
MKLGRQYMAKLAGNVVNLAVGAIVLGLVPHALGPVSYGRYAFLANFFQEVKGFLDMGTSSCFYTKLSQRQNDTGLVTFYYKILFGASVLMIGGAVLLACTPLGNWLWVGEGSLLVGLAACFAAVMWWLDTTRKIVDARHLTIRGELLYAISRVVAMIVLVLVIWRGILQLEGYFIYLIVTMLLAIAMLKYLLNKHAKLSEAETISQPCLIYLHEFWDYSHPLIVYGAVGVLVTIADRWILQAQAGAIEQGFFGLASQVAVMCFLFTSAMTQLLSREFAVAWDMQDMERMRSLFRRIVPLLYTLAAYFSVFIAFRAEDVVWLLGGKAWGQGAMAMSIMSLYPMHQTYGQLSGSVFLATGQTRIYRNINISGMLIGVPVMLWMLLPVKSGGLGLGAIGLALKMVALQVIFVNIGLWFNARLLSLNFLKLLAHQLILPTAFLLCALASSAVVSLLTLSRLSQFLLAGVGYTFFAAVMIMLTPQLAGLQRGDIVVAVRKVFRKRKWKVN